MAQKVTVLTGASGSGYVGFTPAVGALCIPAMNLEDGPAGVGDGMRVRLAAQGEVGPGGGPAGDLYVEIPEQPHDIFVRDGDDLRTELTVTLRQAVLGAVVQVPTPAGPVSMTVPPDSDTGRVLRLRGRGVPARAGGEAGNLLVTLRVGIGPVDDALRGFLRGWTPPLAEAGAA